MDSMVVLAERELGLATDVRLFADACAQSPRLGNADAICRGACLPDSAMFAHLRPQSADDVVEAARTVLVALQGLLEPLEGQYIDSLARFDLHDPHACASSAVASYVDPYKSFDLQQQAAGEPRPLLVCFGERWRRVQTARGGAEHVALSRGDGCGLVYRGRPLGKANGRGERRFISYCPQCNKKRTPLKRAHTARVRQIYDRGFLEYPTFDAQWNQVGAVWIGKCKCGREVETTDITEHRCQRCKERHR